VLALLLSLEIQPSETAQVLPANRLVHGGSASDALSIVVGDIGPPISLLLDIPQDHVFNRCRQSGNLSANHNKCHTVWPSSCGTCP
jgi:hypothetical protein